MSIIYIAARYSRKTEMRVVAAYLREIGLIVTSRWLDEQISADAQLGDHSPIFYKETARIDLDDIVQSDTLLFFSENPLVGTPRGGRHVEFGYALSLGKRVVVIGGPENIFHYLPQVVHYSDLHGFLESEKVI